ncbi:hypothetical protein QO010_002173 [Caulobacter ginsengisoli]|uniref:Uncharacterized protein n=1 Tax=Caulobacter ginsengisoli TaxID=400775 RepID=A0ABU0IQU6_9CAUL|nr:hypothetical protein [Caulobacter ginsengisoli]MDQ0464392.1 hypothetical protein [Caulobacter ginsengisoli]
MKLKLLAAVAGLMLIASPALAASTTVEFADKASGAKVVVTFDGAGMATGADGVAVPYTMDNDAKKLCSTYQDQPICITFKAIGTEVGFTTPYTDDKGNSGVATITAVAP